MNENQAWNVFARTGKIEDYIRYIQIRDQVKPGYGVFTGEVLGADQNPGTYYPGTGSGRE